MNIIMTVKCLARKLSVKIHTLTILLGEQLVSVRQDLIIDKKGWLNHNRNSNIQCETYIYLYTFVNSTSLWFHFRCRV